MSNSANNSNRRLIMPAELLSLYKRKNQLVDQYSDANQNHEQALVQANEQLNEPDDNTMYVLGYN